jgi:hypothetical protein
MRSIIRTLQKMRSLLNSITWPDILSMMRCKCCKNHRPHIILSSSSNSRTESVDPFRDQKELLSPIFFYNIINSDWYVRNILEFSCLNLSVWFDTLVKPQMPESSRAFSEFSSYTVEGLSQFLSVSRFLLSLEYQGVTVKCQHNEIVRVTKLYSL